MVKLVCLEARGPFDKLGHCHGVCVSVFILIIALKFDELRVLSVEVVHVEDGDGKAALRVHVLQNAAKLAFLVGF